MKTYKYVILGVVLVSTVIFVSGAGMYISVPKGTINGSYVEYVDSDTISVTAGYGECNSNYWEITTKANHDMATLTTTEDFYYIYIDDSASVYPDPTIIDSTTEPSFSESKLGWYNGDDRCIGVVRSPSGSATLVNFQNNYNNQYIYLSDTKQVLDNGAPNSSWQTLEATSSSPVNTIAMMVYIENSDADRVDVRVQSADGPDNYGMWVCDAGYQQARNRGWLPINRGASRDLKWWGQSDDDPYLDIYILGYQIER